MTSSKVISISYLYANSVNFILIMSQVILVRNMYILIFKKKINLTSNNKLFIPRDLVRSK